VAGRDAHALFDPVQADMVLALNALLLKEVGTGAATVQSALTPTPALSD